MGEATGGWSEREERLLEAVLEQLPVGVALAEAPSGRMLFFNSEAVRLLGHPLLPAQDISDYVRYGALHEDGTPYRPEEHPVALAAVHGLTLRQHRMRYRRSDGRIVHLSVDAAPIRLGDEPCRAVATFQDVTHQVRAEDALRSANQELAQFAAITSHDLQDPLRTVATWLEVLEQRQGDRLDEEGRRILRRVVDSAERMRRLVRHMLELARVEREPSEPRAVCVERTWRRVQADLHSLIAAEGATVVARDPLPVLHVDEAHLERLLRNLLANAIKYRHPERPPHVELRVERAGDRCTFALADNGIGVREDEREEIFDIFRRGSDRQREGTGIGLAVCRRIVERYGGRIRVEPVAGGGSVFRFDLPSAPEAGGERAAG